MTLVPFFHVAVSVRDVQQAMADFGSALGVTFYEPTNIRIEGSTTTVRRATYTREGPPFLELVQATPEEIELYGEGLSHIGAMADDLGATADRLIGEGMVQESRIAMPGGRTVIWLNRPDSFHGTRLEFFDRSMEREFSPERLERFFAKREHRREGQPAT
jgi:hypothetical protein